MKTLTDLQKNIVRLNPVFQYLTTLGIAESFTALEDADYDKASEVLQFEEWSVADAGTSFTCIAARTLDNTFLCFGVFNNGKCIHTSTSESNYNQQKKHYNK